MGAVDVIEDPVIVGAAGRTASSLVVGIFIHITQSNIRIVFSEVADIIVIVFSQTIILDSIDPTLDLGSRLVQIDIEGGCWISHILVFSNGVVEEADCLHFFGYWKLAHYVAVAVEASVDFLEEAVERVRSCYGGEVVVRVTVAYDALVELAELIADTSETQENET